jgi:hypothetical protein
MSTIIIVKLERTENGDLISYNSDRRYEQRFALTPELQRLLGERKSVFAEARLSGDQISIVRRARDRLW